MYIYNIENKYESNFFVIDGTDGCRNDNLQCHQRPIWHHDGSRFLRRTYLVGYTIPKQNGHHFADDNFKYIFLNENMLILIEISLNFVHRCPANNKPTLLQITI